MLTIGALIERCASYFGDAEAYVLDGRRLTYGQYADRVRRLAGSLYGLGMRRQDRVAILATNSIEYFETYGAAEWAGYIATLVNFRLAPAEILQVLGDADPKVLIFDAQYAPAIESLRSQLPGVACFVCIGDGVDWAVNFESLVEEGSPAGSPIRSRLEDYCHLFYTSGTTGRAKGVPHNHYTAFNAAERTSMNLGIDGSSRLLQITPAFHVGGKGFPLAALLNGATLVLHRTFDPVGMLKGIQEERITHAFMVAAMLQEILNVPRLDQFELSSLISIMTGAAPIPVPVLKRGIEVFGQVFSVQYGMTEIFGAVSVLPRHEVNPDGPPDQVRRLASVGHVSPEVVFRIVDNDDADCPVGVAGEVCIKAPFQFDGYWNNSVATLDTIREGWYHTGDIGYLDEGGYLFLVDRKKDMIITGGENVYSREVENALLQHAAVSDAAVIGVPDTRWGESVKALVVLRPGLSVDEAELIGHCRELIARYKCPRTIQFVPELPRLATGKVDKVSLRRERG